MSEDKRKSTDYAAMERPIFEAWKDAGYFQRTPGFGEHGGSPTPSSSRRRTSPACCTWGTR